MPYLVPGHCRQCYTCTSWNSYDDCQKQTSVVTCSNSQDACVRMHRQLTRKNTSLHVFELSCYTKFACKEWKCFSAQGFWEIKECRMSCCNSTLCNCSPETCKFRSNTAPTSLGPETVPNNFYKSTISSGCGGRLHGQPKPNTFVALDQIHIWTVWLGMYFSVLYNTA